MQSRRWPKTAAQFLFRLFRVVLPIARQEIHYWMGRAELIPDPVLRSQAISSLRDKRFHADGGSVYAAVDVRYAKRLVRLIVAFQTISDYLDNLCDRCEILDEQDFHQLHHAMRDAVRPDALHRPYYALRGYLDDGGYLDELVLTCQQEIKQLPGYAAAAPHVEWLVERYCELQERKHIDPASRSVSLQTWWQTYATEYPDLAWWEFAAATGSTLGMFALFVASTEELTPEVAQRLAQEIGRASCRERV